MYNGKIYVGTTDEGSSQPLNYYFVDADNGHPPLLVTTTADDKFVGVNLASLELDFMERHGLRPVIVQRLKEMLGQRRGFALKRFLMELGNRLVTDHGYQPASNLDAVMGTWPIASFTDWVNRRLAVQEELADAGIDWPVTDEQRRQAR